MTKIYEKRFFFNHFYEIKNDDLKHKSPRQTLQSPDYVSVVLWSFLKDGDCLIQKCCSAAVWKYKKKPLIQLIHKRL